MSTQLEQKLEELRKEWKENPSRRDIVETQVKILKMSENPKALENKFASLVYSSLK